VCGCEQDKSHSGRIRQGSPEEERALGQHIAALAPSQKQLTEAGQLAELLTLLGMSVTHDLYHCSTAICTSSCVCTVTCQGVLHAIAALSHTVASSLLQPCLKGPNLLAWCICNILPGVIAFCTCSQPGFSQCTVCLGAGHEADARVLQQQLSSLVTEQQFAQQYINENPAPEIPAHQQHQKHDATAKQGPSSTVDWKWDILRPVNLPSGFTS